LCVAAPKQLGGYQRANVDFGPKPQRQDRKGGIPMDHTTTFTALLTLVTFGFVTGIIFGMF
jgi:hypothetical protein